MQIYLAAIENAYNNMLEKILKKDSIRYGLISFYYLKEENLEGILERCEHILVDSGAHSFQHGKKVDFDEYTRKYKEFIKKYTDNPRIEGFFEMDIDNVVGYDKVLEYRKELESVSDKIIPVWHRNRGIDDFHKMCKERKGKRVAVTGFKNNDILDSQYNLFLNTAHHYGCKVHILGMTRLPLLQELNMNSDDSCDSSSWVQTGIFGGLILLDGNNKMFKTDLFAGVKIHHNIMKFMNLLGFLSIQKKYDIRKGD